MNIIEAKNLYYKYSQKQLVLDNISMNVPEGSLYGFLGPNGAGKTTTLKLILGLLKKQKGEIKIFSKNFESARTEILEKVGNLIEAPSIYSHLNAKENLLVYQKLYNCPKSRINEVLNSVSLSNTGNKKAGNFSLGMKQKLGIAISLLNNPPLLILDEPTNGLDPNGIIEMRDLLQSLNKEQGTTILISSHILSEIEKFVSHVGIVNNGKVLFENTLAELKKQTSSTRVIIKSNNDSLVYTLLSNQTNSKKLEFGIEVSISSKEEIASVIRTLVKNEIDVYEVNPINSDLETIFMNVINQ